LIRHGNTEWIGGREGFQFVREFGHLTAYSGVGDVIFAVLNVVTAEDFGDADVVVAFPLVEGDFSEEFFLVVF